MWNFKIWRLIRYKVAWWRWLLTPDYRYGDPMIGTGDVRQKNRDIFWERYIAKEPKPEDFGIID